MPANPVIIGGKRKSIIFFPDMPVNKNALLRYRIIDGCLTHKQRKYPTMAYLIEKIEEQLGTSVSESSINKDIQQMKSIYNAPIKYDRYRNGYCYTDENFSIKEFPLTQDEVDALDYSTALLQQLKGTRLFEQFQNAINKVTEGLRISKILGKSDNQVLQVEEPIKTSHTTWLEKLLKSIVEKEAVDVTYQGFGKEKKTHPFSAYLLKEYRNRWYVVGFSTKVEKVIVLALDRIQDISISSAKYISSPDFSSEDFFKYSFGITQVHDTKPEMVILAFSAKEAPYVITQPLHHSQNIISQDDNETTIELNVYITAELKMAILSFGNEVKVLQPTSLQDELKEIIKNMLANYSAEKASGFANK
jgi:predicted DNA-binding transcriptional regulator YafY